MAKKNKNPEVRFKGFTEDWKHLELGEVLTERKSMQKISEDAPILAFASGQGVIDRSERKSNNRDHLTLDQENKVYKLTELNDIVYNPSNLKYGAIDRNKHGRGVISPIYVTFTTEEEPSFIELIVKSEKFKLRALQYEEGTVVKRQSVSPENLLSLKVGISSSLDEQKKIGILFERLDNLITLHQNKYEKFMTLKKVFLKQMFPEEGSDVPKIRFKEFLGNWNVRKLSDGAPKIGDGLHGTPKYVEDSGVYFINGNNLNLGTINISNETKQVSKKEMSKNDETLGPNTILMSINGTIGNLALYKGEKVMLGKSVAYITLESFDKTYTYALLQSPRIRKYFINKLTGSTIKNLGLKTIRETEVLVPTMKEQKKLGQYFLQIDSLINLHLVELEKLKNIKKACFAKMSVPQD
ncbi:restriction endonuclease subunit S [Formosa sp. L2A11]|uniref:restriction endonuclease subunit S n=1 Tax=Formosa sp. L2A11 TaxID=2686363 RepID=UPI00131E25DA|nr:restriction endonuclease subunit S [Formosa sp. L2A11]